MSYQKHNFESGAILFASQLNDMDNQIEFLSNQGSSFSDDFKTALLNCFENVAWINENGQTYYDALYDSLYPDNMWFITNVLIGCVTSNNATSILKNNSYVATITASEGYTLDGATVSITMGGNDVTNLYYSSGSINIPNVTGDLVITVTATSAVTSISAVFTQGSAAIYDTDSLDTLRQYLVVTAIFSDSTTATVTDYMLSGTLMVGTSTITASYGGKTDTFNVTVTSSPFSAVFTQGEATIWSDDILDVLRQYLVVTLDGVEVSEYTLSGTLDSASSVITVSYNGYSTTITVSVTLVGTTEYASDLSDFTRVNTTGRAGYSDGVLWLKCSNATDISNWAVWVFDPKKTLWSTISGKKLRIRFHGNSPDWSGDLANDNRVVHGLAIFSSPSITSGSGRQKWVGLADVVLSSTYQNFDYVFTANLSNFTGGTGTPTSSSTFGVTVYSQTFHKAQYDSISVREVLN